MTDRAVTGIVVALYPADKTYDFEIQRAPDVSGAAGTFATVANVAGGTELYTDRLPKDATKRWYRIRHVGFGDTPSTWIGPISGTPDVIPSGLTRPALIAARLLNFTWTDPSDTTRTFTWTTSNRTDAVWVYANAVKAGNADPYDAASPAPSKVLTAAAASYTITKPLQGYQVFAHFVPRDVSGFAGEARHSIVDPAPSALSAEIKAKVTYDKAALTLSANAGASNWPVTLDLFEDDPEGGLIYSTVINANAVITGATAPAIAARQLPNRELRRWYLRLTDVAGLIVWSFASADRDALAAATVTTSDFRADAGLTVAYDDDTDGIRVTVPSGKVKSVAGLSGSGVFSYKVGQPLDDYSLETLLTIDETRATYLVEVHGGGTWTTVFSGPLHGKASHPPIVRARVLLNTNADAASIYVTLDSPVGENVTLLYRDSESIGTPELTLCVSATDATPRYASPGTEVGPVDWLTDNLGTQAHNLSAIALKRDQVVRRYVCGLGQRSGVRSSWIPVVLSQKGSPYLESISATWNAETASLVVVARGGANCASVSIEISDDPTFAPVRFSASGALADGGVFSSASGYSFPLSGAELGKVWYVRATPYNLAALAGLAGSPVQDSAAIPSSAASSIRLGPLTPVADTGANTITVSFTSSGAPAGTTYALDYTTSAGASGSYASVTSGYVVTGITPVLASGQSMSVTITAIDSNNRVLGTLTRRGQVLL